MGVAGGGRSPAGPQGLGVPRLPVPVSQDSDSRLGIYYGCEVAGCSSHRPRGEEITLAWKESQP